MLHTFTCNLQNTFTIHSTRNRNDPLISDLSSLFSLFDGIIRDMYFLFSSELLFLCLTYLNYMHLICICLDTTHGIVESILISVQLAILTGTTP